MLVLARTGFTLPWPDFAHVMPLLLQPLDREAGAEMIARIAEDAALPSQVVGQLVGSGVLLRRGDASGVRFRFKHELVREAAYGSLARSQRRELHARIAATIKARFPEIVTNQPELLARHYAESRVVEHAIDR